MPYKDPLVRKIKNREYQKKHYSKNKGYYHRKAREYKDATLGWLEEYKSNLSCCFCGESHPATLDFHHLDAAQKENSIAKMAAGGCSRKKILEEIDKCIVVCSNCHRKIHLAGWTGKAPAVIS